MYRYLSINIPIDWYCAYTLKYAIYPVTQIRIATSARLWFGLVKRFQSRWNIGFVRSDSWTCLSTFLVVLRSRFFNPAARLHDFVVGLTMTHPANFRYHPDQTSVIPYLKVCYQHPGPADPVMMLKCTQPVMGRYLVITMPNIRGNINLAQVILDSDGRFIAS